MPTQPGGLSLGRQVLDWQARL